MGKKYIETERNKEQENKNVKEQGKKNQPKTVRVRTLVIVGILVATHAVAFAIGMNIKDQYNTVIDRAVEARLLNIKATQEPAVQPAPLK